jgi:D-arabinose 5-phosphate isomerase GutQ
VVNKEQKPFRLVNENGVSIHHVVSGGAIWRSAFIFGEGRSGMVNRSFARRRARPAQQFRP